MPYHSIFLKSPRLPRRRAPYHTMLYNAMPCMYVFMHACMYVCMSVCMYVYIPKSFKSQNHKIFKIHKIQKTRPCRTILSSSEVQGFQGEELRTIPCYTMPCPVCMYVCMYVC